MKMSTERRGHRAAALLALALIAAACGPAASGPAASGPAATITPGAPGSPTPLVTASGTLAPVASESAAPATALAQAAQEPVTYSPPPPPTPTPSPQPGLWRWEGVVVDGDGKPLADVCVAVGPHGCVPSSPRTDARGVWFIDFPQAAVDYDLHFIKPGYAQHDVRITPTSPWTLDVVLRG